MMWKQMRQRPKLADSLRNTLKTPSHDPLLRSDSGEKIKQMIETIDE